MMVVIVGRRSSEDAEGLRLLAMRAELEPLLCPDAARAREVLADPRQPLPRGVLVDGQTPGLEAFVAWLRGEARLFGVPVIVRVPALDEGAFCDAHALGADDVVIAGDTESITGRFLALRELDPEARPPISQGRAVVAHADERRRRVLGRILRQAGFDPSFAASPAELREVAVQGPTPALVVAGSEAMDAVAGVRSALAAPDLPFVVLGAAGDLRSLGREADRLGRVGVTSELGPPDDLLFLANELLRPDVTNVRASARLLYGALCSVRAAGTTGGTWGLTYNVSREGLYVRTLQAPAAGTEVWLELRPPRAARTVHLTATVVWRRGLAQGLGGSSPPGFGARILPEACATQHQAAYLEGYERLRAEPRLFR